jgi:hypothetical protein
MLICDFYRRDAGNCSTRYLAALIAGWIKLTGLRQEESSAGD